jgi:hypothetical protein
MIYDVIGDVHGKAPLLKKLLSTLGYRRSPASGAYCAQDRRALFLGDLVDRGENQLETVKLVRSMVDEGFAECVLGNHEFNAVMFATEDPSRPGVYLRKHTEANVREHSGFLKEFGDVDSPLHREWVGWFKTIPMWQRRFDFLAVHACFDPQSMTVSRAATDGTLCLAGCRNLKKMSNEISSMGSAAKVLLKGPEVRLPCHLKFTDKNGKVRTKMRIRWWQASAPDLYDDGVSLNCTPEEAERLKCLTPPYSRKAPDISGLVFIGHYWLPPQSDPRPLTDKVVCCDYSAGIGGPLCAYSHEFGQPADSARFTLVRP